MHTSRFSSSRPVYSTDSGTLCPACGNAAVACSCKRRVPAASADGIARIARSTKGRSGKTVTVVTGLGLDDAALAALAKLLKAACGSGGTVKDGIIEVQGDHGSQLLLALAKHGFKVRLV